MRVSARYPHAQFSGADLQLLKDLARQVGITLRAAQLTEALQSSRQQLVTAREEERRRIRRDLHDGLGPTLSNFAMRLEQARESLPPGAAESEALLDTLSAEAQQAISDIRRLVYELRPSVIDEYGLVSALREYLHKRLAITLKTARNHVSNILSKLQVADRTAAIVRAREAGLR
ncbi:MAG: histidine kinase [Caldilineaceae bacterium]